MCLLSWFPKHKDQLWTHLGSVWFGVAIYGPESAEDTNYMAKLSELIGVYHNFLPNAVINLSFWLVIYNFPHLAIDILVDHILGHKWWCHIGYLMQNGHNGHYGTIIYDHNHGWYGCLSKDKEKCRSPVKNWLMR